MANCHVLAPTKPADRAGGLTSGRGPIEAGPVRLFARVATAAIGWPMATPFSVGTHRSSRNVPSGDTYGSFFKSSGERIAAITFGSWLRSDR